MRSKLFSGWGYEILLERLCAAYEKGIAWVACRLPKKSRRERERRRLQALKRMLSLEGLEVRLVPSITNYVPLATFSYTEPVPAPPPILATFTDTSPAGLTVSSGDGAIRSLGGSSYEVQGAPPYTDEGTYTESITVTDWNSSAGGSTTTTVNDATLTLGTSFPPSNPVEGSSTNTTLLTFTDGNVDSTTADFSATVTWGDGTNSAGTITLASGIYYVAGAHTWADEASNLAFKVVVTDDGGNTLTTTATINVVDAPLTAVQTFTPTPGKEKVSGPFSP